MPRIQRRQIPYSLLGNGTTQYGVVTAPAFASATKLTITGWIKLVPSPSVNRVVYEAGAVYTTNSGFAMIQNALATAGDVTSLFVAHCQGAAVVVCAGYTSNLPANVWLRFCHTIDEALSSEQNALYINGVPQALTRTANGNCQGGIATQNLNFMSRNTGSSFLNSNVILDKVIIGKAFTASEALEEYATGRTPSGGTTLLSYAFDATDFNTASVIDYSASGKNIALTGSPSWSIDTPMRNNVCVRNVTHSIQTLANTDRVSFGNTASLQSSNGTISVWVKIPRDIGSSVAILSKDHAFFVGFNSGVLAFYDWGGAVFRNVTAAALNDIRDNKWHRLTLSYQSGVANGTILCVDGVVVARATSTVSNQTGLFSIGNYGSGAVANSAINGAEYADGYFYNVALTSAQIESWYRSGSAPTTGLVSRWRMNEGSGTSVADSVGSNTGTITGSRWLTDSPMRSRVLNRVIPYSSVFNGSTQYGRATAVPFANATKMTIFAWIKPSVGSIQMIAESSTNGNSANAFFLYFDGTSAFQNAIAFVAHDQNNLRYSSVASFPIPTGQWTRVCVTVDEALVSDQTNVFTNGVASVSSRPNNQQCVAGIATNDMYIASRAGTTSFFNGNIIVDRVIIGKAFTAAEVLDEYLTGRLASGGTNLLVYPWNEGSGTTIADTSGNGKNIALTGTPPWSSDTPMK